MSKLFLVHFSTKSQFKIRFFWLILFHQEWAFQKKNSFTTMIHHYTLIIKTFEVGSSSKVAFQYIIVCWNFTCLFSRNIIPDVYFRDDFCLKQMKMFLNNMYNCTFLGFDHEFLLDVNSKTRPFQIFFDITYR